MYLLMLYLPLISSFIAGFFGRYLGFLGSAVITSNCSVFLFILSLLIFYEVGLSNGFTYILLATWINSELLQVDWGFLFDSLTVIMCLIVTFVSFLVHVYSVEYMSHDAHLTRFMSYLSLFTFFMLILVTGDNLLQLFVGWEGVGFCSYLLINFWFTRIQANKAAIKAMILNRIGDFSLIIGILLIYTYGKAIDYSTLFMSVSFLRKESVNFLSFNLSLLSIMGIFLFIGAMGKSALLGLHTWLPDAMEGPTPVSALIHAATMVTAGVFLLARISSIYENSYYILKFIVIVGTLTCLFASTVGLMQNDLKRVIAYSTCSQLGYMVFSCGFSNYCVGIFHLSNHAFFKALLFLGAGSIIHAVNDEQDMRKLGGLKNLIPFTYSIMLIGSLALIGFPFLTGFYSKDLILETSYSKYDLLGYFSYCLGTLSAFFTAYYSIRLLYFSFIAKPMGYRSVICLASESRIKINYVLRLLAIPSVFVGYISKDAIVGIGNNFFSTAININVKNFNLFEAEYTLIIFKNLPVFVSLLGGSVAFVLYNSKAFVLLNFKFSWFGRKVYRFLNRKWFFDKICNEYFNQFFLKFGYSVSYKLIDRGIFELLGPTGLSLLSLKLSFYCNKTQSNHIYHYTFLIIINVLCLLTFWQMWILLKFFFDYRLFFLFLYYFLKF